MSEDKFTMPGTVLPLGNKQAALTGKSRLYDMLLVVAAFIASRLVLSFIGLAALHMLPSTAAGSFQFPNYPVSGDWSSLWHHWDSAWYDGIAENGYEDPVLKAGRQFGQASYAFFPLLPWLTRFLAKALGMQIVAAGALLSNAMILAGGIFLYRYVLLRFDRAAALTAVTVMYFFPGSFVYSSFMTESLYLGLTIMAFFYMEKEQYGRGALAASLVAIARAPGILLFFLFVLHWLRKNHDLKSLFDNDWQSFLKILLIPLPLMLYMGFLLSRFGSAFAFSEVHIFWGRTLHSPIHNLIGNFLYFRDIAHPVGALNSLIALFSVAIVVVTSKSLTVEEILFSLAGIMVPLSTSLESAIRLCDVIFPVFITIALFSSRHPRLGGQLIASLAMINALLMVFWAVGAPFYV